MVGEVQTAKEKILATTRRNSIEIILFHSTHCTLAQYGGTRITGMEVLSDTHPTTTKITGMEVLSDPHPTPRGGP